MNASYATILAVAAPVFVVLGCGFLLRKSGRLRNEADSSLLAVAINFLFPCFIADTVLGNPALRDARNVLTAPVVGFFLLVACFGISWLVSRLLRLPSPQPARTFAFTAAIPNWGYLPIPLVQQLFDGGTVGVLFVHNVGLELALWSVGVWLLAGEGSWKRVFNVPFLAILTALALNLAHAGDWMPRVVLDSLHLLGQAAIPLSLLLTGAMLADAFSALGSVRNLRITVAGCVVRLLILPPVFLVAARWLPCSVELKRVLVVQSAMPCALVPVLLARYYRADLGTAVHIVIATTIVSLLTIPLWIRVGFAWLQL